MFFCHSPQGPQPRSRHGDAWDGFLPGRRIVLERLQAASKGAWISWTLWVDDRVIFPMENWAWGIYIYIIIYIYYHVGTLKCHKPAIWELFFGHFMVRGLIIFVYSTHIVRNVVYLLGEVLKQMDCKIAAPEIDWRIQGIKTVAPLHPWKLERQNLEAGDIRSYLVISGNGWWKFNGFEAPYASHIKQPWSGRRFGQWGVEPQPISATASHMFTIRPCMMMPVQLDI